MNIPPRALWVLTVLVTVLAVGCTKKDENGNTEPDGGEAPACAWDEYNSADTAGTLTLGTATTGYLCPYEDQDWYQFTVGAGSSLVTVLLVIDAPVSPVDPTYTIWSEGGEENLASPDSTEAAMPTVPLQITHNLGSGNYLIVVRDRAADGEDTRHPYQLTVTAGNDADTNEPNNTSDAATAAGTSLDADGYLSYRGDEDWYAITANDRDLVIVDLTMPAGGIQPAFRIVDGSGAELASQSNPGGAREATALNYVQALATAGTYYVVVYDDDNKDSDGSTSYNLQLSVVPDPDDNESNDTVASSTTLAEPGTHFTPYLASTDDIDWYAVDSDPSDRIIQVDVVFDDATPLPEDLQAAIRLVYAPADPSGKTCDIDQDCQVLNRECDNELDCAGIGNTCLVTGYCAGAGICLPEGRCGANIITEWAKEYVGGVINPNRGSVSLAAPTGGADTIYVAVQDYHANASSLTHSYDVMLSYLGADPDTREPSAVYTAGPPQGDHDNALHMALASEVDVYGPNGCSSGAWTTGVISYTYDQDWYMYEHPCPEEACMLEFHYDFSVAGPVDFYAQVYRPTYSMSNSWMDNLTDTVDVAADQAKSGSFGGYPSATYCYYAYNGDGELSDAGPVDPYYYYINIRDMIYRDANPEGGTWDWDREQPYRFCIEMDTLGCELPCTDYDDGEGVNCGFPVD